MIAVIKYLIEKKLLINLTVALIAVIGITAIFSLNREAYPEVSFDMVSITTVYPGGAPDELENLVTIPIEKKLKEVDGLDKVRSYNIENVSVIAVYIDEHAPDKDQVVQNIKDAVDLVEDLPENVETPLVEEITTDKTEVLYCAIHGKDETVSYSRVRNIADQLEDFIYEFAGVAEVEDLGFYDREYLVEVNPDALEKYRIGMNNVIGVLANRNIDLPGGSLRIGRNEYVLRTKGQYRNVKEVGNTVVMANDVGFAARIKNLAHVTDTFEEPDIYERYQGQQAVIFKIWKKRSADEINLADRLKAGITGFHNGHDESVVIDMYNDTSEYTRNNINSVLTNAVTGFALLALILFIFLGWRMSTLMTASIPLVFLIAFIGMQALDVTINVISLFGMIMVLGMIVDFGIVVSENAHRYLEKGLPRREAILKGVNEVVWPVTVTFLCISAAFMPLLILTGIMGKFIKFIPLVVMISLAASWFVALFFLPSYLNMFHSDTTHRDDKSGKDEQDDELASGFFSRVQLGYMSFLRIALRHRYITISILVVLLVISVALIPVIGFVFSPGGGSEKIEIKTYLPNSRNLEYNLQQMKVIESSILELPAGELEALHARVGTEVPFGLDPKPGDGTHKSTLFLYLTPERDRERVAADIAGELRQKIDQSREKGKLSTELGIKVEVDESGPPVGKPVNVEIRGEDFDTMLKIASYYTDHLKTLEGVYDISTDFERGKTEYRYRVNELTAGRTGVSVKDIAQAIHASFEGVEASSIREGEEEIGIRVRFTDRARKRMKSLNEVKISNNRGGLIPLGAVTHVNKSPGYAQINRLDYKRVIQVQANVDTEKTTSVKINNNLQQKFADLESKYPGYNVSYGGEHEETSESMAELGSLFQVALLVIYIVLAAFFGSMLFPFVVMSAIPFSLVGVIFALFAHGEPMSFMTALALFSLSGVIVSNTVTLVEFINIQRDQGKNMVDAVVKGSMLRLRPVILTTGTTVLGLMPSIYGIGEKNYHVAPLALAFGYGLIFATIITLLLVPSFYHIAEDIKGLTAKIAGVFGIKMNSSLY
ncbi:MAG: efflux RND transporter permease subunit [Spirochaetota bacterium]